MFVVDLEEVGLADPQEQWACRVKIAPAEVPQALAREQAYLVVHCYGFHPSIDSVHESTHAHTRPSRS